MRLTRRNFAATSIGLATLPRLARAADLATPTDRVILTVSGKIGRTNGGGHARFDRQMLEALGPYGFTTRTPWYDGPMRFDGVRMSSLMEAVQAHGESVIATALNDYETHIPISDFAEYGVLLAMKRNGEYMPVRDKGPLFILYPFDENPTLQIQKIYGRCAWQLARMTIT
ncbi:MAG: molybdopterin-dependent oxidoreductase [Rhodospirillales bacterium]|nr:molybdopterin-dependent oxidoreductase [Rhodospirillales bacterium]